MRFWRRSPQTDWQAVAESACDEAELQARVAWGILQDPSTARLPHADQARITDAVHRSRQAYVHACQAIGRDPVDYW